MLAMITVQPPESAFFLVVIMTASYRSLEKKIFPQGMPQIKHLVASFLIFWLKYLHGT